MLGDLGKKLQRVEDLEVAADAAQQLAVAEGRKRLAVGLFGTVDDLAASVVADADRSCDQD